MKRVFCLGALVALMAVGGSAEDPKPAEKKDPFREFKIGEHDISVVDEIRTEDFKFSEPRKGSSIGTLTAEMNIKNLSKETIRDAELHLALFDADHALIDTATMRFGDGSMSTSLEPKVAAHVTAYFESKAAPKAKFWQFVLVVPK